MVADKRLSSSSGCEKSSFHVNFILTGCSAADSLMAPGPPGTLQHHQTRLINVSVSFHSMLFLPTESAACPLTASAP